MRKKLAIVGCATRTRDDVDYTDPDLDIWVLNESAQKDWCKRADAVIQMHPDSIWKNPLNRGDKEHGKWLMSGNTPPVFMLEKYPEIPKSIKYPKDEIIAELLPNFTVDSERGRKDYFTSSLAYAYALGIYLGYQEIHTYGVELADEEEYREQQPAAMFWNGIAIGRGVKWISHSQMFDCPLYPVETFIGLPLSTFEEKIKELTPKRDELREQYRVKQEAVFAAIKHFEETGEGREAVKQMAQELGGLGNQFGLIDGAMQENERWLGRALAMQKMTTTFVFSKHEFKRDQAQIGVKRDECVEQELKPLALECDRILQQIQPLLFDSKRPHDFNALRNTIEAYVKASVKVGMYHGAVTEDGRFIDLITEQREKNRKIVAVESAVGNERVPETVSDSREC